MALGICGCAEYTEEGSLPETLQLIQINDHGSPWGCSWLTAPPGGPLLFDIENLHGHVSLEPFSHTLSSSHSLAPFIHSQLGPSGPAERVSVCAEWVEGGRFDSHTEV